MNKNFLKAVIALLLLVVVGCSKNDVAATKESNPSFGSKEVLQSVYDDQHNTVYIKVGGEADSEDEAIGIIMKKKENWEKQFPSKRVVAMTIVNGTYHTSGSYASTFHSYVAGLLIHYEQRI